MQAIVSDSAFQVTLGRLFQFKLIKIEYNLKINLSVLLAAFLMFNSPMWLVTTILESVDIEHFH